MKTNKPHKVTGYLVYDPELRFTPGGHAVCTLWIGSADESAQLEPKLSECENWALWRDLGEQAAELLKRGDLITLRGTPKTSEWADRETGEKKSRLTYNAIEWIPVLVKTDVVSAYPRELTDDEAAAEEATWD